MFKKIVQYLFGSGEKISLSCLRELGEKSFQGDCRVFGKGGDLIATIEKFTQPVEVVTNSTVKKFGSINSRVYKPAPGTKLANMGIESVTTTKTPLANGLQADVIVNGQKHTFGSQQLKNYIALKPYGQMKV